MNQECENIQFSKQLNFSISKRNSNNQDIIRLL